MSAITGTFPIGEEAIGGTPTIDDGIASAVPDLLSVGTLYEVAINGVGYMLVDTPEGEQRGYRRSTVPLESPRLVTSETAFNDSFERYSHTAFADFTAGAGQEFLEREDSSPAAFFESEGVNPFEAGKLTLLKATEVELFSAYATPRMTVVGDALYTQTGDKALTYKTAPGGAGTSLTVAAATVIEGLATDGQRWYAAAGAAGVFRGTTTDPGAAWSAVQARVIGYAGNRVCVAYRGAGSTTPNVFSTLTDAGVEEVANGRIVLPVGWTIVGFTGGSGQVWFGAYSGNVGVIYRWKVGTTDTPAVAMELPAGQVPRGLFWYQGQVLVRSDTVGGTPKGSVYRCPIDTNGNLTPFLVTDRITVTGAEPAFAASERLVFFSWPAMGDTSGIGAIDLTSGGYTRWFGTIPVSTYPSYTSAYGGGSAATANGSVRSIVLWHGRIAFTLDAIGVIIESADTYLTSGTLTTSISDRGSSLDKVYDSVTIAYKTLLPGEQIKADLSFDNGVTFVPYSALTVMLSDTTRQTGEVGKKAASIALQLTLVGPGTSTPTLTLVQVRQHVAVLGDTLIQLGINCADDVSSLTGSPLPGNGPGNGARRARTLEALIKEQVKFQDRDYPLTLTSDIFEVETVDVQGASVFDRHTGRSSQALVAYVVLRKGV